jgi:hypothetical protein
MGGFWSRVAFHEGVGPLKCEYHPRAKAEFVCSVCGIGLCERCAIEDRGRIYCDGCYASEGLEIDDTRAVRAEAVEDSEDYIDLELMDILDTEDDDGLF